MGRYETCSCVRAFIKGVLSLGMILERLCIWGVIVPSLINFKGFFGVLGRLLGLGSSSLYLETLNTL